MDPNQIVIEFIGRIDHQIKIHGIRIEVGEIQCVLEKFNCIESSFVDGFGIDGDFDKQLVAYIILKKKCLNSDLTIVVSQSPTCGCGGQAKATGIDGRCRFENLHRKSVLGCEDRKKQTDISVEEEELELFEEIRKFLVQRIPVQIVPSVFILLSEFPLNSNGKVDKKSLPTPKIMEKRIFHEKQFVEPSNDRERKMVKIWCHVLRMMKVSVEDDFFALGGDSMVALRIISKQRTDGISITVADLYKHRTIRNISESCLSMGNAGDDEIGFDVKNDMVMIPPFGLISERDKEILAEEQKKTNAQNATPGASGGGQHMAIEDMYPMSQLQIGMVFHSLENPNAYLYQVVTKVKIHSYFNEIEFKSSLFDLISRHSALRTSYDISSYSTPMQRVHSMQDSRIQDLNHFLEIIDLDTWTKEMSPMGASCSSTRTLTPKKQFLERHFEEGSSHVFDFLSPHLFKIKIFKTKKNKSFYFFLIFHDSIMDGWSRVYFTKCIFSYLLKTPTCPKNNPQIHKIDAIDASAPPTPAPSPVLTHTTALANDPVLSHAPAPAPNLVVPLEEKQEKPLSYVNFIKHELEFMKNQKSKLFWKHQMKDWKPQQIPHFPTFEAPFQLQVKPLLSFQLNFSGFIIHMFPLSDRSRPFQVVSRLDDEERLFSHTLTYGLY